MEKEKAVKELEKTEDIFGDFGVVAVYIFGSTAREESHKESDIDVGVLFEEKPRFKILISLATELKNSTGLEIDVSCLNQQDIILLHDVITEGILIYESDKEKRVDFEVDVDRRYHDQKPLIEEYWRERRKRVLAHA